MGALRDNIVGKVSERTRGSRMAWLEQTFPDLREYRVLDMGGRADTWVGRETHPAEVVLLNMPAEIAGTFGRQWTTPDEPWMHARTGDGCAPPDDLGSFDLVFSNSTIEHVGGFMKRQAFAAAVRRLAPRYWVQTPYRYFPVEPHWVLPGAQFLPLRTRAELVARWPLSLHAGKGTDEAIGQALWIELLSKTEMSHLFPDGLVMFERVAGLPKSLVATRA